MAAAGVVVVAAAGVDVVVAAYADGASTWTSHHEVTPPGPAAVVGRGDGLPAGTKVVAAGVDVVVVAAGANVVAAAGRVVAAATGSVLAAGGRVPVLAGRVVAAAPAAGSSAHLTAVLTTQVKGRLAATSPTVTWPAE